MDKEKFRNTQFVIDSANENYRSAIEKRVMQVAIHDRDGKSMTLDDGRRVVEFINCSYLGLDVHPDVQSAYRSLPEEWGVNFCCARSRFSIAPLIELEERLSTWLRGRVVTFPSVTTTHVAVMPLVASGALFQLKDGQSRTRLIFDKLAHSSMQFLKPVLAQEAVISSIRHNDLQQLIDQVLDARRSGELPIYVADGIYSMGGIAPIRQLLTLAEEYDFYLYLDDAHGTSIFGEHGEGAVLNEISGPLPDRLILTFSLSKAFGVNGGGVVVPHKFQESQIRTYGQIYAFSAPLDFASIPACLASLDLHESGAIKPLQQQLRERINLYDTLTGSENVPSPIRMVKIGDAQTAIAACDYLVDLGYFTSVVFFPIVGRGNAQLRISLSANHTEAEIIGLTKALRELNGQFINNVSMRVG